MKRLRFESSLYFKIIYRSNVTVRTREREVKSLLRNVIEPLTNRNIVSLGIVQVDIPTIMIFVLCVSAIFIY